MKRKIEHNVKNKIMEIANERFILEGLARIALESLRNGDNLKSYDSETLVLVLYQRIKALMTKTEYLQKILNL